MQLTPEGTVFYERSLRLLADLDEAESGVGASEVPSGRLRINTNVPIGRQFLLPLVPEFLALYPAVTLDIVLTDTVIDLMADRTDVAIRGGPLKSSSLVARKLGETPKIIVGSPDYLARHGRPERPADLARHNCMELGYARAIEGWHLIEDGVETVYPPVGSAQVSDGDSLRELALAGAGLARLSACIVRGDIAAGRLVPVLEAFSPGDTEPFHIVYLGQRGRLPARVRAWSIFWPPGSASTETGLDPGTIDHYMFLHVLRVQIFPENPFNQKRSKTNPNELKRTGSNRSSAGRFATASDGSKRFMAGGRDIG